jgi:hypothetical protein
MGIDPMNNISNNNKNTLCSYIISTQPKYDKDCPNKQSPKNKSKPQEKKGHGKTKKDTGKWCNFHKIPWHNTEECRSK